MSLKDLSDYTVYSRYAHYIPELKRRETWDEIVERVFGMHERKYATQLAENEEFKKEFLFAKEMVRKKRVLGSQRALQFGGKWIEKENLKIYNCSFTHLDRVNAFSEIFYALLCGVGVGYSVQLHHIQKLPQISRPTGEVEKQIHIIEDSIQGWSDALAALLSSYFVFDQKFPYFSKFIQFDYSKIRPEGALIAGQFKAPGPNGLRAGLEKIRLLLDNVINQGNNKLSPINCYDIICHTSDCVLSGGIRRAASLCLFSKDDEEMMKSKTGDWYIKNPQRARSNNSVILERDKVTKEEFNNIYQNIKEYGEPAFYFTSDKEVGPNPCFTKDTKILTSNGWETFGDLLGKNPEIIQDNRVEGKIIDNKEEWNIDLNKIGCTKNIATKVFKTAEDQEIFELSLSCGRSVKATKNHHFATKAGMVELKDLKIGDELLIAIPELAKIDKESDDFKLGYLAGHVAGDGCFIDGRHNTLRFNIWGDENLNEVSTLENYVSFIISKYKNICKNYNNLVEYYPKFSRNESEMIGNKAKYSLHSSYIRQIFNNLGFNSKKDFAWMHTKSKAFKAGFVSGLSYTDGHSEWNETARSLSFRISNINIDLLKNTQLILQELGIFSRINLERKGGNKLLPDSNRELKLYKTVDIYRLIIGGQQNCFNFQGITNLHEKDNKRINFVKELKSRVQKQNFYSSVSSIKKLGNEDVYCLVENNRRTLVAEGITSRRCVEISMYPVTIDGRSGIQGCNLSEINGKYCTSLQAFLDACRAASTIGTLQAGYTNFNYLSPESKEIFEREALLGVSLTGWMENPDVLFKEDILKQGSEIVKTTNKKIAAMIGINPAARTCCVKPAGSTSCILETSSGIHPHHAKRYIRNVQSNKNEFAIQHYKNINSNAVEDSVWSANKTDYVVSFACEVPKGSIIKNNINAIDFLNKIKFVQENWVRTGNDKNLSIRDCDHNVSCTVVVNDNEWDKVRDFIFENKEFFTGISLISSSGDLDYRQAPFTTVLTDKEIVEKYGNGSLLASGLIVDGIHAFNGDLYSACEAILGISKLPELKEIQKEPQKPSRKEYKSEKQYSSALVDYSIQLNIFFQEKGEYEDLIQKYDWIRRARQFADRYFNGDIKLMTYCLKHVDIWKKYLDINREHKVIDWSKVIESTQELVAADSLGAQSCSGGACSLSI